ncbi:MAG TPA: hypothetical protein PLT68_01560 [Actinomycetota bacterium]|nr:hypothetical protein [Actinomycetota bacterium]
MVRDRTARRSPRDSRGRSLPGSTYSRSLLLLVAATLVFRIALGSRASFTGDDFIFRAEMADGFSLKAVLAGHNGHLNPLGLTLQWILQHAFPGRFVPLMVLSALLVAGSQLLAATWVTEVFASRWLAIAAAAVTGLSPMLLELATWWSVALYAAPMVAAAWLTVLVTTRFMLERAALWMVLCAYSLCLASSTKAVLIPMLLLGIAAGIGLGRQRPLGFRRALTVYSRLWLWVAGATVLYGIVFGLNRGPISTANPTPGQMAEFVRNLFRIAAMPALWGGPWTWASLGFHAVPAPVPRAILLSALACLVAILALIAIRPRTWRIALAAAVYLTASSALVALGRAGSPWGAPVLRYTFDFVLPTVLVMCAGVADSRWEEPTDSAWRLRVRNWWGWRPIAVTTGAVWMLSLGVSYALPWSILPDSPMKKWVTMARTSYPELHSGLLQQWAPASIAVFPQDLDTFLAGDPDKPPQVRYVMDRVLGFDGNGRLVTRDLVGTPSVPARPCTYRATLGQISVVPLTTGLPPARHTVAVDYSLNIDAATDLRIGDGDPVAMSLPAGVRRVYVVLNGQGGDLTFTVSDPNASLCILSARAGGLVDGPLVGRATP